MFPESHHALDYHWLALPKKSLRVEIWRGCHRLGSYALFPDSTSSEFLGKAIIGSFLILLVLAVACNPFGGTDGSGTAKTETRSVKDFTTIGFSGTGKVIVEQTGTESLSVTADDNILPLLETSVTDGKLSLGGKSGSSYSAKTPIEFKVGVKDLSKLSVSGAGNVEIVQLKTNKLEISVSGVGDVTISGSADALDMTLSGTGSFHGDKFRVKQAKARCSGVGSAVVNASDDLDASVSGVGSIEYVGSPNVKQSVSGIGSVKKK